MIATQPRRQTFTLLEASLALYPAGPDGVTLAADAVWFGGCAEGLRLHKGFIELLMAGTGESFRSAYHVDEEHAIEIGRIWVIPMGDAADFEPGRNQRYVMEVTWQDEGTGVWHRRTYYGVTFRGQEMTSRGVDGGFDAQQIFRAQRYSSSTGSIYAPLGLSLGEQPVPFFHDGALITGEYFVGHYRWPVSVLAISAKVIARAGQGSATVLSLEVDGAATGYTLTIPAGAVNEEVSATVDLNYLIGATREVRWKVLSGPSEPEDCAWVAAVVMQVAGFGCSGDASSGSTGPRFDNTSMTWDSGVETFDER